MASEIGEVFKFYHKQQKEERWRRSRMNLRVLDDSKIEYTYHANTGTVIVGAFVFWTTTGRWRNAKTLQEGRDADEFIQALRSEGRTEK